LWFWLLRVRVPSATRLCKAKIASFNASDSFNLSGDWYLTKRLRFIAGISNLTDEKYYDRVFANGIEPAPRRSDYAGLSLAF
jgi:Fe(3+) dicitrate transport protein